MVRWKKETDGLLAPLLASKRVGLITDMDGTISSIVSQPDQASIVPESKIALEQLLNQLTLVAVISGRMASDIHQRLGLSDAVYVGNHGMERWQNGEVVPASEELAQYRPAIDNLLAEFPITEAGMWVEDKTLTLSIHYRQADDPAQIKQDYTPKIEALAAKHGLDFFPGRMIFEIRPPVKVNKGTAFRALVEEYQLEAVIWLGDDVTDTDAMQVARQMRETGQCHALSLGVITSDTPALVREHSDITAQDVDDVASFLAWLAAALKASST